MSTIKRLLRKNISSGQFAGYAAATLVGLSIVITALQFYRDVTASVADDDSFVSSDYAIISKRVEGLGSLVGSKVDFSPEEIEEIERQPWADKVGRFEAAAFDVFASVNLGGRPLSTSMFLEAIPDEFFDIKPDGWDYQPGDNRPLPIVISKDYLTLYNFGYAATRSMPQISEAMVSAIPLRLSLSGNGRQEYVDARIVGFSSRLNTIAVPVSFLRQANETFSSEGPKDPSRLIIKLKRAGDPDATDFFKAKGYEVAGDKADNGKAAFFLSLVTSVVIIVGAIIALLAFFILLLSIWLLMQKNRDKIHRLMELGYKPRAIAAVYYRIVGAVNLAVLLASIAVMAAAHCAWGAHLHRLGLEMASLWPSIAVAVAVMALITLGNCLAIRRKVIDAFRL